MHLNEFGQSALGSACFLDNLSLEVISKLIDVGGKELVMQRNKFGLSTLDSA